MSLAERVASVVTTHSKIVLVALLLATALVGAGMPMVDDDSSLEQFESDSEEAQAAEYVSENFTVEEAENTSAVQLILREDDALSKESLIASLEFQQEIRDNESINATLVEDDPITGVENVVAMSGIRGEQAEELAERGAELENRSAELDETAAELETRGERLEAEQRELETEGAEVEARAERLNETSAELETALDRTVAIQTEYTELNVSYEEGEIGDGEYQQRAAELETRFDELREETTEPLDDEQAGQFETAMESARTVQDQLVRLEYQYETGDVSDAEYEQRSAELEDQLEEVYHQGTQGVLADEYEQLEADQQELEERGDELEAEGERLEEDQRALEAEGDELEAEGERLEEDQRDLEEADSPSLDEQIEYLEDLDDEEFEELLEDVLSEDSDAALALMPTGYEPGSTDADARMMFVTQSTDDGGVGEMGEAGDDVVDTQLELRELANHHDQEYVVFGFGIISDEIDRSMGDSLSIVGPLALLFVVVALLVAYRDPLDIVLGVAGILAVLVWTFGFMGWAGIAFNQMFVAVPVLLIGLSIDYAIHVFMRHREQREARSASEGRTGSGARGDRREHLDDANGEKRPVSSATREQREADGVSGTVRDSMTVALAGVGVALLWVTATTVIGFLSNLISPIGPIREFGVVSAVGILAALVVFGALVPAAKVELDSFLESRGYDRRKRAFGTGGGRFSDVLSAGEIAARKAPLVVLLAVLLLTAGGVYGATQVDTSFEDEDFLADDPPAWTEHLGPLSPGEYQAKEDLEYVNENFQREDAEANVLVRGDVTDDETLERVAAAEDAAADSDAAYTLASGDADVRSPLSAMEETAAENESFNESFHAADTTGDEVPDRDLEALYDELLEANPDAADVVYRTADGEYEAIQLVVAVRGDAPTGDVTDEMRAIAAGFDDDGADARWNATATGSPIVNHIVEQDLLETVLESLLITLVAVFAFLSIAYWLTGNSASLGAITLLPVAFSVSWILGTMYVIGMPFNVLTGMITSLTIGLGVAYSIHISSRYTLELERQGNVWTAMRTTVMGTGGALLGSAATTVGGFGTLALAILPALRQFGIITGLTIIYAFLASVIVLPSLLVLWTRYFGPDVSFDASRTGPGTPTASDGGRRESESTGGEDE